MHAPFLTFIALAGCLTLAIGDVRAQAAKPASGPTLTFQKGDRVTVVGAGFVENDREHADLEARLQRQHPALGLTFSYLGWSGDTVSGAARVSGFQVPDGMGRLEKDLQTFKPNVVLLAYGFNESFQGRESLERFLVDYGKLVKSLEAKKFRLAILSPTFHEDLGRPFPDPSDHNEVLRSFTESLRTFANDRKLLFVDLLHPLEEAKRSAPDRRLTTNGLLLNRTGYAVAGRALERQLGYSPKPWRVVVASNGAVKSAESVDVTDAKAVAGSLSFRAREALLPMVQPGDDSETPLLTVTGLLEGDYVLLVDGVESAKAPAKEWGVGVKIVRGPLATDGEQLRQTVSARAQIFYRRWRPYNDHSRHWGFIGGDFKLYDDEMARLDHRIAELRQPRRRTIELKSAK